ncbi:hypothetical protein PMAYCL1PPCAC_19271, partial [Pristionchus mayeri]
CRHVREQLIFAESGAVSGDMRYLVLLLVFSSTLEALGPRLVDFVNNCGERIQVVKQASIISSESEAALLEPGQNFTGNFSIGVVATSFTKGAAGLTQVSFRSFLVDRIELDVRKGFDTAVKVEASGVDTVLTCSDANCCGDSNLLEAIVPAIPYNGDYKITFCP